MGSAVPTYMHVRACTHARAHTHTHTRAQARVHLRIYMCTGSTCGATVMRRRAAVTTTDAHDINSTAQYMHVCARPTAWASVQIYSHAWTLMHMCVRARIHEHKHAHAQRRAQVHDCVFKTHVGTQERMHAKSHADAYLERCCATMCVSS